MARTYTRDARGRFASKGAGNLTTTLRGAASGRAPRRLEFLRTYHGTSPAAARSIRQDGYRESAGGVIGPGVYTTRRKSIAQQYANASSDMSPWTEPGQSGVVMRHRVYRPSILRGELIAEQKAARAAGRAFDDASSPLLTVLLPKAVADRSLVRESGMVRRRRRR